MRLLYLFAACVFCTASVSAQQVLVDSTHRHEVGVDVTTFLRQFLSWGDSSNGIYPGSYTPSFWATYRYHFKGGNIRFAAGGFVLEHEMPKYNSTENDRYKQSEVDLSVGIERAQDLSKRWQVYYGLDFRPSWTYTYEDYSYSNAGYQNGREVHGAYFAVAPLLGMRYRIAKRFSILTEASLSLIKSTVETRKFYMPANDQYPPLPDLEQKVNNFDTRFQTPISVIATFDL